MWYSVIIGDGVVLVVFETVWLSLTKRYCLTIQYFSYFPFRIESFPYAIMSVKYPTDLSTVHPEFLLFCRFTMNRLVLSKATKAYVFLENSAYQIKIDWRRSKRCEAAGSGLCKTKLNAAKIDFYRNFLFSGMKQLREMHPLMENCCMMGCFSTGTGEPMHDGMCSIGTAEWWDVLYRNRCMMGC